MACDLCGAQGATVLARIEGVTYRVCAQCASYGEVIHERQAPRARTKGAKKDLVVRSDASNIIRSARERKDLSQKDLARMLAVKESDLHAWETGHRTPTLEMARTLEKRLGVSLVQEMEAPDTSTFNAPGAGMTIGDLMKKR